MTPSLRDRNRRFAYHHIRETGLSLFAERGFDLVSIEDIAQAAGVSASTVYRYFGSKEFIAIGHEFFAFDDDFLHSLDLSEPKAFIRAWVESMDEDTRTDFDAGWRGLRYVREIPSVRVAHHVALAELSDRLSDVLAQRPEHSRLTALFLARAYVFGYAAAAEQWVADGAQGVVWDYFDEVADLLPSNPAAPGGDAVRSG